jgi:hypothetical protein
MSQLALDLVPAVKLRVGHTATINAVGKPNDIWPDPTWSVSVSGVVTLGTATGTSIVITGLAPGVTYVRSTIGGVVGNVLVQVVADVPDYVLPTVS